MHGQKNSNYVSEQQRFPETRISVGIPDDFEKIQWERERSEL
jgi:hypothetical protein